MAWRVGLALAAPELSLLAKLAAAIVLAVALWRPAVGLVLAVAWAPAGALLSPEPARTAELIAWAFLSAWLLGVHRPLAPAGWSRTVVVPTLLFALCATASWVALTVANAGGVPPLWLPQFMVTVIPQHYLVSSPPETETSTILQLLAGVGLFFAGVALARTQRSLAAWMAWAVVASSAVLAVVTVGEIARQWAANDYAQWFIARYFAGERFSAHLEDVNAAGSLYALAIGVAAALATLNRSARWWSIAAMTTMGPALVLTGSRSALFGVASSIAALALIAYGNVLTFTRRRGMAAAACVVALVVVAGVLVSAGGGAEPGSAGNAMRLRSQFAETSIRMFASAPILGVGVGRYFERSPEFMPDEIRELYGAENAHNYYAQAFAELGLVGGAMFLWLVVAGIRAGWRQAASDSRNPIAIAIFVGAVGYLVTCLTGHPFLVAETALPFWAVFGVLAALAAEPDSQSRYRRVIAIVVLLVGFGMVRSTVAYALASEAPPQRGFIDEAEAPDGTRFRWMGPHAVIYGLRGPGFFTMTVRAPDRPLPRPMVIETRMGGRVIDRRTLARGKWETVLIPVRQAAAAPFRRIDVRATPAWMDKRRLAQRPSEVDVAATAMVREMRWLGPGAR
jgi:O-antigen ligase